MHFEALEATIRFVRAILSGQNQGARNLMHPPARAFQSIILVISALLVATFLTKSALSQELRDQINDGTGTGNPGYSFADEFTEHTHIAGALSMADSGPNTNGCQFFITYTPQHSLDGKHSVFGQLLEGMDVLKNIESGDSIVRITIEEK